MSNNVWLEYDQCNHVTETSDLNISPFHMCCKPCKNPISNVQDLYHQLNLKNTILKNHTVINNSILSLRCSAGPLVLSFIKYSNVIKHWSCHN